MEYIDIFDENNNSTGKVKEKQQAHEDGNFHRTVHVWIINDKNELLLQKRSASKKTHPNCWDISGAGHIKAGESVVDGAIRELKEELGVEVEEKDLQYIATIKSTKNPKNMEFQYVYLLNCNKEIEEYIFEDNEVSEVKYIFYKDLEKMVEEKIEGLLIHEEEYKYLFKYITNKSINIRKCNANDVDSIYNIQNIVIDNFKEEEKGYFLPFKKDTYLRIVNDPINDGEIYLLGYGDEDALQIIPVNRIESFQMERKKYSAELVKKFQGLDWQILKEKMIKEKREYGEEKKEY